MTSEPEEPREEEFGRMTVAEHLEELRRRVIHCLLYLAGALVVCCIFNDYVMGVILKEPLEVLKGAGYANPHLLYLGPTEGFVTWLKLALIASVFLASPLIIRELWGFVAAGLYPRERKYVERFAPASFLLFLGGVLFLYFIVMPPALKFLFTFNVHPAGLGSLHLHGPAIQNIPQVSQYLSLYITMSLIMGFIFQLPLVMLFLIATHIVEASTFSKYRRHFIVGAVAVLAVLTPTGDAVTLVLVSTPVVLLYEGGLLLGRMALKRRQA